MLKANRHTLIHDTLWLQVRLVIATVAQLAATRFLLSAFGDNDFGLWSTVLSLIMLWAFPTDLLGEVSLRWLSVSKSPQDKADIFCALKRRAFYISVIATVIACIVTLCWLYKEASISPELWSVALFIAIALSVYLYLKTSTVQYISYLIADERYTAYAWLSILESLLILCASFVVAQMRFSSPLQTYAVTLICIEGVILAGYWWTCRSEKCNVSSIQVDSLLKGSWKYTLWMAIGSASVMLWLQGIVPVMNHKFDLEITASVAIAMLVLAKYRAFCSAIEKAIVPRLMKGYAMGEYRATKKMLFEYCLCSLGIILAVTSLLYVTSEWWLRIWLAKDLPAVISFVKIALIAGLLTCLDTPLNAIIQAKGDIRNFQLCEGFCLIMILPIMFVGFSFGLSAVETFALQLIPITLALLTRIGFVVIAFRHKSRNTESVGK